MRCLRCRRRCWDARRLARLRVRPSLTLTLAYGSTSLAAGDVVWRVGGCKYVLRSRCAVGRGCREFLGLPYRGRGLLSSFVCGGGWGEFLLCQLGWSAVESVTGSHAASRCRAVVRSSHACCVLRCPPLVLVLSECFVCGLRGTVFTSPKK